VKITPALPNPHQASVGQDKGGVAAVSAPVRVRDAVEHASRRQPPSRVIEPVERERLAAEIENRLYQRYDTASRAGRAIASYASVADTGDHNGLRDLLGFDAYA